MFRICDLYSLDHFHDISNLRFVLRLEVKTDFHSLAGFLNLAALLLDGFYFSPVNDLVVADDAYAIGDFEFAGEDSGSRDLVSRAGESEDLNDFANAGDFSFY